MWMEPNNRDVSLDVNRWPSLHRRIRSPKTAIGGSPPTSWMRSVMLVKTGAQEITRCNHIPHMGLGWLQRMIEPLPFANRSEGWGDKPGGRKTERRKEGSAMRV